MNFTVVWPPQAEQHLAAVWLGAADQNAVTRAANVIDLLLAVNPNAVGSVVFDTVREYIHPPLGIEFEIIDADRQVVVLTVWDITRGRPGPIGN